MRTLLFVMSICVVLIIGCGKKDGGGKEVAQHQNDELIQEVNKVNSDLGRIRTRNIYGTDPQSLTKISVALRESREKITALESRIDSARLGDVTSTQRTTDEVVNPSERMSEGHFKRRLEELAKALEGDDARVQLSAARSVRELQASYPDRDFSIVLIPLMGVVKNEHADSPLRIVAARALHAMDSERGNFAIKGVARESKDQSVKKVCALLSVERTRQDYSARLEQELDKEEALAKR